MPCNPLVSVVIPTYNRVQFLVDAIDSVMNQTCQDFEIIVTDDGSTDGTVEKISSLYPSVRLLIGEHTGRPSDVRNRGIIAAQGEYVAFLDDDDLWHPSKLEQQVALLEGTRHVAFVYSDVRFLFPDGLSSGPVLSQQQMRGAQLFDQLLEDCFIYPSTVLVHRQTLEHVGGFDETLAIVEDYDLWLRLAQCTPAACVPKPLVYIRHHGSKISQLRELLVFQNAIIVLERALKNFPLTFRQRRCVRTAISRLYCNLGHVYSQRGNYNASYWQFTKALRLRILQRQAWVGLARHYFHKGNP